MVFLCLSYPVFSMLQGIGRAGVPLRIMLAGTAAKLAGNILLIPETGVDGAAISTSLSYALILFLALRTYFREADITLPAAPFVKVLYAGAMCGGAAWLAAGRVPGNALRLIIAGTVGGAVYAAVLRYALEMKMPRKDRGRDVTFSVRREAERYRKT